MEIEEFYIIIFIGLAYGVFVVIFDKYLEGGEKETLKLNIYRLVMVIIIIITSAFAEKYHMTSTLIMVLAIIFIEKIKKVSKE